MKAIALSFTGWFIPSALRENFFWVLPRSAEAEKGSSGRDE